MIATPATLKPTMLFCIAQYWIRFPSCRTRMPDN